jgi:excisionase family DNA binding protein
MGECLCKAKSFVWQSNMATATTIERLAEGLQDALMRRAIVTVSVKDAIRLTGLSERSLRRFIAAGRLRSTKVGTRRLLNYEDVKALAEGRQ